MIKNEMTFGIGSFKNIFYGDNFVHGITSFME